MRDGLGLRLATWCAPSPSILSTLIDHVASDLGQLAIPQTSIARGEPLCAWQMDISSALYGGAGPHCGRLSDFECSGAGLSSPCLAPVRQETLGNSCYREDCVGRESCFRVPRCDTLGEPGDGPDRPHDPLASSGAFRLKGGARKAAQGPQQKGSGHVKRGYRQARGDPFKKLSGRDRV